MANPDHPKILKQGVKAWNRWRLENPWLAPWLDGADFRGFELEGVNLNGAFVQNCDFRGARMRGASLQFSRMMGTRFKGADLSQAEWASPHTEPGEPPPFGRCEIDLADIRDCDFSNADLQSASLHECTMRRSALVDANLSRSDLSGTTLSSVDLTRSFLGQALFSQTILSQVNLSGCEGLKQCRHFGHSLLDVHTLTLSWPLPRVFLRNCGFDEQYIDYLGRHFRNPAQFHSCFISYSHKDKAFARRLYDSLQGRGIRCWLDKKNVLPGQRIMRAVNEAIRINDKLLLCCSEASLQSSWVEDEIAAAVRKEREESRDVLIPLNLDGYFLSWKGDHSVRIQERLAADFTGWESDNAKFESEFEKVVEALRPQVKG